MTSIVMFVAAVMMSGVVVDDAMEQSRLEQMLEDGQSRLIVQVFRRHPGKVLPFVDSYLEGGLKIREEGGDEALVQASYAQGLEFAELASKAFDDEIFIDYAASFASWSPKEQLNFRLGQKEFREGRAAQDDHAVALAHFQESLALAESLHDTWGRAMANSGLARRYMAMEQYAKGFQYAERAAKLYGRLRLAGSEADALVSLGAIHNHLDPKEGLLELGRAWTLLERLPSDDARRQRALSAYRQALERAGHGDRAKALDALPPTAGR